MARHKRRKQLTDMEKAATAEAIARLHRHLMLDCLNLAPAGEDYAAVSRLSADLVEAIRALTGEDPEWMRHAVSVVI